MSTDAAPLMTAEEMLALPDNGMDRDLIEGQLREQPMTTRGRPHSEATIACGALLRNWAFGSFLNTVTVHRPDANPVLYNDSQELSGDRDLPGFQLKVADLFV